MKLPELELSNVQEAQPPEILPNGDILFHNGMLSNITVSVQSGDTELATNVAGLVNILTREVHFAIDEGNRLYYYNNGVYNPNGEHFAKLLAINYLEARDKRAMIKMRTINEVAELIAVNSSSLSTHPNIRYINLLNGIYDTKANILYGHSPKLRTTIQLPITYDPNAVCPKWDTFISEVFPTDTIDIAYDILAWLIIPLVEIKKMVLLLGGGNNGKSLFIHGIQSLLGKTNYSNIPLHDLLSDKYALSNLRGKLANICGDIEGKALEHTGRLKLLTGGGDGIEADQKYKDRFKFQPFARHIYSANSLPRSADKSDGFISRFCILPFINKFEENTGTFRRIKRYLSEPTELSGLFNKLAPRLSRIKATGIPTSASMINAIEEYIAADSTVLRYVRLNVVKDVNNDRPVAVPFEILYNDYVAWCKLKGVENITSKIGFGRDMAKYRPDWKQHRISGGTRLYYNLRLLTHHGHKLELVKSKTAGK